MHGFFSQFWNAECSCERSSSLSSGCSEFLESQTGSESLQFFEVALPCALSEGKSKELRGICVSHLGPSSSYTRLLTPVFGGMVNGFATLTLNPSLCVRAQGLLLIYWHWWPCPFSSEATPTQVRGEADRREREAKELSWRGSKMGHVRGKAGAVARGEEERLSCWLCFQRIAVTKKEDTADDSKLLSDWESETHASITSEEKQCDSARGGGGVWEGGARVGGGEMMNGQWCCWTVHPTLCSSKALIPFLCFSLLRLGIIKQ